jgi:CRISPR-associated protein Cmr3
MMSIWIIDPHDPLIFRDGKPFGPTPGVRATSLPFPFPSTVAGGARSQAGLNKDGIFQYANDQQELALLKKLQIRGPLLVELERDKTHPHIKWFAPAPIDALLLPYKHATDDTKQQLTLQQLLPIQLPGACTDLDEQQGNEQARLQLVGQKRFDERQTKPAKQIPIYWNWSTFGTWLYQPDQLTSEPHDPHALGIQELPRELRVHVSMDSETHTGKDGALFDTSGIEFTVPDSHDSTRLSQSRQFALALLVDHDEATQKFQLQAGLNCLGSERRIVSWSTIETEAAAICPPELCISTELRTSMSTQKACRVILLTPAYFAEGFRPSWILEERYNVHPQLRALAIQRPKVISGWDIATHQRKPSRRLAAAGTVLYISFAPDDDATNIERWIDFIWMQCISDDIRTNHNNKPSDTPSELHDQYRLDGFGLAVLGTWNGQIPSMQLKPQGEQLG